MSIDLINSKGMQNQNSIRITAVDDKGLANGSVAVSALKTTNEVQENGKLFQEDNEKRIKAALDEANSKLKNTTTRCEYFYHETTKRISIKLIDKETDELIREFPPEKTLETLEKIWEIAGLLVDEKR